MKIAKNVVYEEHVEAKTLPGRDLRWLFTPESGVSESFSLNVVEIKPGNTVKPAHSHPNHEELIYVVSGEGEACIDGEIFPIRTGTAVLFPKKSIHQLRNNGSHNVKVACFFVPQATMADYTFHEEDTFPNKSTKNSI